MLTFLSNSWFLWLALAVGLPYALAYQHKRRAERRHTLENIEEFHFAPFYNIPHGEGVSLLGFVVSIVSFSLFLVGILKWVDSF